MSRYANHVFERRVAVGFAHIETDFLSKAKTSFVN
jgi:hypothetical protein